MLLAETYQNILTMWGRTYQSCQVLGTFTLNSINCWEILTGKGVQYW